MAAITISVRSPPGAHDKIYVRARVALKINNASVSRLSAARSLRAYAQFYTATSRAFTRRP